MVFFRKVNTEKLEAERDVPGLLKAMGHKNPEIRRKAEEVLGRMDDLKSINAMGKIGSPNAVKILTTLVDKGDTVSGTAAVQALEKIRNPCLVGPGFLKAVRHDNPEIRSKAVESLRRMDDPDSIDAMGKIGDLNAVDFLVAIVEMETGNRSLGPAAVQALGEIGAPRLIGSVLLRALRHNKPGIRQKAVEALRRMDDPDSIDAMGKIGDPNAVDFLTAIVEKGDRDSGLSAIQALVEIGDPRLVGPILLDALDHNSSQIRWKAAELLGRMDDIDSFNAMETLTDLVEKGDSVSGPVAVQALVEIGDSRAVEPLIHKLKAYFTSPRMRETIAHALGEIPDARSVEPLIKAMSDDYSNVREMAYWSLHSFGTLAVKPLIGALQTEDNRAVSWTVSLLGRLREPKAAGPLVELITQKQELDEDVRSSVYKALKAIGNASVAPLVAALRTEDSDVRLVVLEALIGLNSERSVEPIIEVLSDEDWKVRRAAAEGLGQLRDARAVGPLIDLLRDEEGIVGNAAAKALGRMGDSSVVPALIEALKEDQAANAVAEALGEIGDPRAADALLDYFKDTKSSNAAEALVKIGDPRAAELLLRFVLENQDPEDSNRSLVLNALYDIGPLAVDEFLTILSDETSDLRAHAAWHLGQAGDRKAVDPLIEALSDESLRKDVATALALLGDSRAVVPLIDVLQSKEWISRAEAVQALGCFGDSRAVGPLISVLQEDTDSYVRYAAVKALGELCDARAVDILTAVMMEEGNLRKHAAKALGKIGDEAALDALISILHDESPDVPETVIKALGQIGSEKAVEPLLAILRQGSLLYKSEAVCALGEIGSPDAVEPLIETLESVKSEVGYDYYDRGHVSAVRNACVNALGMVGDERVIDPLITAFRECDSATADSAAWSLGRIDDPRAFQALVDAVKDRKFNSTAAADVLGDLSDKRAVAPLINALVHAKEPNLRSSAAEALGKLGDPSALDAILYALEDEENFVRIEAARALGSLGDMAAIDSLESVVDDEYEAVGVREAAADSLEKITEGERVRKGLK